MEGLVKGDVVILPFPFSDLSANKKRPALVVADLEGDDVILVQITSESHFDNYSVDLRKEDFKTGTLLKESKVRTNKLFTANKSIILYKVGTIKEDKIKEVEKKIVEILKS